MRSGPRWALSRGLAGCKQERSAWLKVTKVTDRGAFAVTLRMFLRGRSRAYGSNGAPLSQRSEAGRRNPILEAYKDNVCNEWEADIRARKPLLLLNMRRIDGWSTHQNLVADALRLVEAPDLEAYQTPPTTNPQSH